MKLPIYAYGHPNYRQESKLVSPETEALTRLVRNMKETLWLLKCEALSAFHVGLPLNLFVIDIPKDGKKVFLNAQLIEEYGAIYSLMETDVSVPNVSVGVDRLSTIKLKFQTETFEEKEEEFSGKTARLIMQMLDLNQGKTMIQQLNPFRQRSLKRYLREIRIGKHQPNYELIIASSGHPLKY